MSKRFKLSADEIKPLAVGRGACFATDMITVDGSKVGYMYREEPRHETDSGWVFMAGVETQDYMDEPGNLEIYDVNTIANHDSEIISFLDAPFGSAFVRNPRSGKLEPEDDVAASDVPPAADVAPREICDTCGCAINPGRAVLQSRTDTEVSGAAAFHRTVHLTLCPTCAEQRDDTGNRVLLAMAAFVAIVVALGLAGWMLRWVFR
ncbi:MAG: DUF2185 domain-containing protein [Planctomycetes bacterium]|nr:DUF2185 domain-containing protein [Planctomycetota bacterium]